MGWRKSVEVEGVWDDPIAERKQLRARIAELEARIAELEAERDAWRGAFTGADNNATVYREALEDAQQWARLAPDDPAPDFTVLAIRIDLALSGGNEDE